MLRSLNIVLLFSTVGGKVDVKPSLTNLLKSSIAAHATRFRLQHPSMYASSTASTLALMVMPYLQDQPESMHSQKLNDPRRIGAGGTQHTCCHLWDRYPRACP
jgi:hypothetical protein